MVRTLLIYSGVESKYDLYVDGQKVENPGILPIPAPLVTSPAILLSSPNAANNSFWSAAFPASEWDGFPVSLLSAPTKARAHSSFDLNPCPRRARF
jgi:hypothetical protein